VELSDRRSFATTKKNHEATEHGVGDGPTGMETGRGTPRGSRSHLLDLVAAAARSDGAVYFPDGRATIGDIWALSADAASWIAKMGSDLPVAMWLSSDRACVAALLGAWRLGRTVVSLPLPGRGTRAEEFVAVVRRILKDTGAEAAYGESDVVDLASGFGLRARPYPDVALEHSSCQMTEGDGAQLVQFTSGSTHDPKGIVLSLDSLAANVEAVLEAIAPGPDAVACSWLPLSHDMGLIGMFLTSVCAAAQYVRGGGELHLLRPEQFLARPASWLDTCARVGATVTAAPNFALEIAVTAARARGVGPLGRLETCIVGGEPVRARTLERFEAAFRSDGLRDTALCPAYGLAEATLAVTLTRPSERWTNHAVPGHAEGQVVGAGRPVAGVTIAAPSASEGVGPIAVRSPSLLERYLGGPRHEGWFETRDEGFVDNGILYPTGRAESVVHVRGRNIYAVDIEHTLDELVEVRSGCAAVLQDSDGAIQVYFEPSSKLATNSRRDLCAVSAIVATHLARRCGFRPDYVAAIAPGTVPKTTSGKKRHHVLAERVASGEVRILADNTGRAR
jgi:acyl-CoA synthetase (AMP-forming)/AMP-acid ligase II